VWRKYFNYDLVHYAEDVQLHLAFLEQIAWNNDLSTVSSYITMPMNKSNNFKTNFHEASWLQPDAGWHSLAKLDNPYWPVINKLSPVNICIGFIKRTAAHISMDVSTEIVNKMPASPQYVAAALDCSYGLGPIWSLRPPIDRNCCDNGFVLFVRSLRVFISSRPRVIWLVLCFYQLLI